MECAAKGSIIIISSSKCIGPATRRCGHCGAVAYCSVSHQIAHWSFHKEECERLEQHMRHVDALHDFPFTFSMESTIQICEKKMTRCSFLMKRDLHQVGMWNYECKCGASHSSNYSRIDNCWSLPSESCPCCEPLVPLSKRLNNWEDYYEWRCLPLYSPVSLLLHWPLTLYHVFQLTRSMPISEVHDKVHIHYLGPERELLQLSVFAELQTLFPGLEVNIELIGPAIPQFRDGEKIDLCSYCNCFGEGCSCKFESENASQVVLNGKPLGVTLKLHKGFYHDLYGDIVKDSFPHFIFAANAGVAVYSSWLPTIELIKEMDVPAVFTDYCEEAANLAASCISTVTGRPLTIPIQLNPFRQPMVVEDSALILPCYSNCFLFGM
ncbi:hypothetical protein AQUCO_02500188v1 [Aquilegia coerulea]|uniref:MYND-type domain-containing protein n=1 Tax=Aquilegia coerulea TaxID=218851 RepID=A0A2G5D9Y4_AQUCA|nr:hypothetical protein AQUCO_02500188v1 [Aquilegia coerulea]